MVVLVAFDLYGTLLSTASISKKLASQFRIDEKHAASFATAWRKYQLEYSWRLQCMGQYAPFSDVTRRSLSDAAAEVGVKLKPGDADAMMTAYDGLDTFPDVSETLTALAATAGVEPVIFSNGTRNMISASVENSPSLNPLKHVFQDIVTVDDVRAFKPARASYEHLARARGMGTEMQRAILISGNPFDVVGARAAGMQAIWVDRARAAWSDALVDGDLGKPTATVTSLDEIVPIVLEQVTALKQR